MNIYEFEDYKEYYNSWVAAQPKGGHGEYRRLSLALEVSTTMISQVFKGEKNLSLELACDMSSYLSLDDDEINYFLLLVELARSGSFKLRSRRLNQVKALQKEAQKLENVMSNQAALDDKAKAMFYSSWAYSGVRILTDIDEYNDSQAIAERLSLPRNDVQRVLDFLIKNQLCIQKEGKIKIGPARTHVGSADINVGRHLRNWRLRGFEKMVHINDDRDLFFTSPLSMSIEVANSIRQKLPHMIAELTAPIFPSEAEVVRCLNVDWFEY